MRQLPIGVLVVLLFGNAYATAAPTTELPPSPSASPPHAIQVTIKTVNTAKPAKDKTSKHQTAKAAQKKAIHNTEKKAPRLLK
ncbi:hypothetical protein MF265_21695 [Serratia marcescens]|uniref:hypothetical protein n=1 Tax=Serratia marcescens TaxID=615 RepID=UPI001EF056B1|nr:hypothetical protein [Serratia marcescens]ULH10508.1 hypothetical protein MF265_21695 [Serratia marcescens]